MQNLCVRSNHSTAISWKRKARPHRRAFFIWVRGGALAYWLDPPGHAQWLDAPLSAWASPAALGWLGTNLAFGLWTHLLKRHPASRVAPFSLGIPLLALLAGVLLVREQVSPLQWVGAGFVFAALMCAIPWKR